MSELSNRTVLHKRISNFTDWIKPEKGKRDQILERSKKVRDKIEEKAIEEGMTIHATPYGGSFSSRCGLKRHFRGNAEVEGLDVDICFVVNDSDKSDFGLSFLLDKFHGIVKDCYPDKTIERTKSSIKLKFNDHLFFDIVPLLKDEDEDCQILIRSNGERIKTSVKKHTSFVRERTKSSALELGRVHFNECLRLLKWWRDHQASDSYFLGGNNAPPSFLMNLLAAKAYDELSVHETFAETLAQWFSYLAHVVRNKEAVLFNDYSSPKADANDWSVLEPVNPENNIVSKWNDAKRNELADWFEKSSNHWNRALRFQKDGDDKKCLDQLIEIFGNSFKNHCDNY